MTKKQYRGKMMQLQRNLDKIGKAAGMKHSNCTDRVAIPNWGVTITYGKHKGEILTSYEQAWDMISEFLQGTPSFEGIK